MPKIAYREKRIGVARLALIAQANQILDEYQRQGYDLTLRQLYYQFVARDIIPNTQRSYKNLGNVIDDGRMCGLIDWLRIEDRTRNLVGRSSWGSPTDMIESAAESYHLDRWEDQDCRVEVWCEKEALIGIFARVCHRFDIDYFACRGYVSQSEMWRAARRLRTHSQQGKTPIILHFGDHDPSGIDMTRDIGARLDTFGIRTDVQRLALNMDQVEEYSPPPNPAKTSDSRFQGYVVEYGDESWELDALQPAALTALVTNAVEQYRDLAKWTAVVEKEQRGKSLLQATRTNWDEVVEHLEDNYDDSIQDHLGDLQESASYQIELGQSDEEE